MLHDDLVCKVGLLEGMTLRGGLIDTPPCAQSHRLELGLRTQINNLLILAYLYVPELFIIHIIAWLEI